MAVLHGKNYGKPTLDLNFAGNKSLIDTTTGRNYVTFTRAQSGNEATYVGSDGLIKYASADEPRFDHDPETLESLGLLVEESRTNLCIQSETFTGSPFTLEGATASKTQIAPDGSTNATLITLTAGDTVHRVRELISIDRVLRSFFVKKSNCRYVYILDNNGGFYGPSYKIDLDTGSITLIGNSNLNIWPNYGFGISEFPNGYYRVWFDAVQINMWAMYPSNINYLVGQSIPVTFNADGTEQFIIWGYQVEEGSFPTSYIPTSGSTETRAADEASITGTNFSSWYNQSEGTIFTNVKLLESAASFDKDYGAWFGRGSNSISGIRHDYAQTPTNRLDVYDNSGNLTLSQLTGPAPTIRKAASAIQSGSFSYCLNGTLGSPLGVPGSVPTTLDRLLFGGYNNVNGQNKTISRLTYYPKRLPDIELQQLTK